MSDISNKEWQTGKPPHAVVVEVEYDNTVVQGRALWGDRDAGRLPHWELANGVLVEPGAIKRWREL